MYAKRRAVLTAAVSLLAAAAVATFLVVAYRFIGSAPGGNTAPPEPSALPAETADAEALGRLTDWSALPVFDDGVYAQQSSAQRADRVEAKSITMLANGNRDMNNFLCAGRVREQSEREGVPISLDLDPCPESYPRGFVISRFEGSGRLARLWMTSSSLFRLQGRDEVLRIYVDDRPEPLIQLPLIDAITGRAGEIFGPPFGAGSRFYLAWYYPVVFASKLMVSIDRLKLSRSYYHQTAVVLDRQRRPRSAVATRLPARDRAVAAPGMAGAGGKRASRGQLNLAAGERVEALALTGPGSIRQIEVRAPSPEALRHLWLEVRWDGSPRPAIALPLLALFASELEAPARSGPVLSARVTAQQVLLALRLPMPFRSRASWTLQNRGATGSTVELVAQVDLGVPQGDWGRLHTQYSETRGPTARPHHPVASVSGRGRLAGVCISMEGHSLPADQEHASPLNFLEGDELVVVDGRRALVGTGTEDYFNSSFYFADGPFANAYAQGQKRELDDRRGTAVCCRWHVLGDAIDFASRLDFSLEIGPGQPSLLDRYRSVAFVYR